jgi:acyl carrier protein
VSASCAVEVAPAVQQVAQELLAPGTSLDAPLMEAGLDSLGAVEFRSRLSSQLGNVKLPETLVFDFPTLRQIEMHLDGLLATASNTVEHAPNAAVDSVLDLLSSLTSSAAQKPMAAASSPNSTTLIDMYPRWRSNSGLPDAPEPLLTSPPFEPLRGQLRPFSQVQAGWWHLRFRCIMARGQDCT